MKVLLDENITPKVIIYLKRLGYDVESIQSYGLQGISDKEVLELAVREERILITQNGKDFIIQVPPRENAMHHNGLIWLKFHVTKANAEILSVKMNHFFAIESSLRNSIWRVKVNLGIFYFQKRYPSPPKELSL